MDIEEITDKAVDYMLPELKDHPKLTEWERDQFIPSITKQWARVRKLSQKQKEILRAVLGQSMRVLIVDDEAKAKVQRVLDHAKDHYYVVDHGIPMGDTPGNDPAFVAYLPVGYRCVFTFTLVDGVLFRHLSISVPESGKYPNPMAAFQIAALFGFTGWKETPEPGPDWLIDVTQVDNCITLAQKI